MNFIRSFFKKEILPNDIQTIISLPTNKQITTLIDQLIMIKMDDPQRMINFCQLIEHINRLVDETEPYCFLSKYKLVIVKEKLHSYIMSLIYPLWINSKMRSSDLLFHNKIKTLSSLITPKFMGVLLPSTQNYIFDNAVEEIHLMDLNPSESPIKLLFHIYECCNSLLIVLRGCEQTLDGADGLVSTLVLAIVKACPCHLISICHWIEDWYNPFESQTNELFCMFSNFLIAMTYIYSLEPNSVLIRVNINETLPPSAMIDLISNEEYLSVVQPLKNLINSVTEIKKRVIEVGIGATIGALIMSPFAISLLVTGIGTPISLGLMTTGITIGSTLGTIVPFKTSQSVTDINNYVDNVNNNVLKNKGIVMINPLINNRIHIPIPIPISIPTNVIFLEFVVKFL